MQFRILRDCWDILKFRFHSDFVKFMEKDVVGERNNIKQTDG